jgi:hypothetical protein
MSDELAKLFNDLEFCINNDMESDRALDILHKIRTLLN